MTHRDTAQRRAVLEVLRRADDHPTAAELHTRVRESLPGVGAATVYRALRLLVESDLARELRLGDEAMLRYDANTRAHAHLVCDGCGRVVDVAAALTRGVVAGVAGATGFEITGHDVRLHGRCPDCISHDSAA